MVRLGQPSSLGYHRYGSSQTCFLKVSKKLNIGKQQVEAFSPSDQVLSSCFLARSWFSTTCSIGDSQWTQELKKEQHCNTWSKDFHWLHWMPWMTEFQPITLKSMDTTLKLWFKSMPILSKKSVKKESSLMIKQEK